jgi:hypothetical protein
MGHRRLRRFVGLPIVYAVETGLAPGCSRPAPERKTDIERQIANVEGTAGAPASAPGAPPDAAVDLDGRAAASSPRLSGPATPAQEAWASALARSVDDLPQRSRQMLSVELSRRARDPRQKSRELVAHMQWCDQGSLESCLRVGHVLLFNECLFDRARTFYQKAETHARSLPAEAVDAFIVDGTPQRQELQLGLRLSQPDAQQDEQRRAIAAICGAVAERDRPLWDEMFARFAAGEVTPAASPSTGEERLALGAIRKRMVIDLEERIGVLERLHPGVADPLRDRLAGAADALCGPEDPVSCGTEVYLHAARCRFEEMEGAYRRFDAVLSSMDPASRTQALDVARDVTGAARAYLDGDAAMRELLRKSMCKGT